MALPTGPYIGRHPELHVSATKPEVEITCEQKELATRFQRLPPQFLTVPYIDMALPTSPNIGAHREPKCRPEKPLVGTGSGNNVEWKEMAMRFQRLPHIFDHARLRYDTNEMARHRPTS